MAIDFKIHKRLQGFSLNVEIQSESQRIGILGASGSGKSMLLKSIAGIETPDDGYIQIDYGTVFDSQTKVNLRPQQRGIGYLFQNYALFPTMRVWENIAAGIKGNKKEKRAKVEEMLLKFHLQELANRLPGELSGGQQQRVALARMMAHQPKAILLDEPFSALDVFLKDRMEQEMKEMIEDYPGTVILVSHNRDEIYRFCEEVAVVDQGNLISMGKKKEIFRNPKRVQAARLTGCKNIVPVCRLDAHTVEVKAWGTTFSFKERIPERVDYIGIRAHDFIPVWGRSKKNSLPFRLRGTAELPFEKQFFLQVSPLQTEEICCFMQREQWNAVQEKGMPDYVEIPEERILFLT